MRKVDDPRRLISVRLSPAGLSRVKASAREHHTSISEILRLAIGYGLDKAEAEAKRRDAEL